MASRAAKLKELRELKRLGRKRGGTAYQDASEATEDIYDEVDDEGMRKIMRERLNEDDFVVDDNGAGYVDNGQDDFEDRASDSGDEEPRSKAQKQSIDQVLHEAYLEKKPKSLSLEHVVRRLSANSSSIELW